MPVEIPGDRARQCNNVMSRETKESDGSNLSCPNDRGRQSHQAGGDIDGVGVEVEVLGHVEHVHQGGRQHGHSGPEDHHEGGR